MDWTWLGTPLDVRPLFPTERAALIDLLGSLDQDEWDAGTACPGWSVGDLVGHLLHDYVRRLSGGRDGHPGRPFAPGEALPAYLTRTNGEFVHATRQLSPRVKADLLAFLGPQLDEVWAGLEPDRPAGVEVSWAAPGRPAPVWLDIAREYTEFWVHQQQIRDAVGRPGATGPELLRPVVDTLLRALPRALDHVPAAPGTAVAVHVTGTVDGTWTAVRRQNDWALAPEAPTPHARVTLDAETLWRRATRNTSARTARARATLSGNPELTDAVLDIVSIVRDAEPQQRRRD